MQIIYKNDHLWSFFYIICTFLFRYNSPLANMVFALDTSNGVIKKLWCIYSKYATTPKHKFLMLKGKKTLLRAVNCQLLTKGCAQVLVNCLADKVCPWLTDWLNMTLRGLTGPQNSNSYSKDKKIWVNSILFWRNVGFKALIRIIGMLSGF